MDQVLILGLGAQTKYVLEIFRRQQVVVTGILSLPEQEAPGEIEGVPVLGAVADFAGIYARVGRPPLIICCRDNAGKRVLVEQLTPLKPTYRTAVHPQAVVAGTAKIGAGSIVNPGAVIQPGAVVGEHVMVHAGVIVEHDCVVEDFVNLAPGAILAGHVQVGRGAYVYSGAVVLPARKVGRKAVIGAGAVITQDVPDEATVVGVPGRVVRREVVG